MPPAKWMPSKHPRDRFGRFTRSRSTKATAGERAQAEQVASGLKPKRGITGARAGAYLDSFAPAKNRTAVAAYVEGGYVDTHKLLRAGNTGDPSVAAMDAAMVDLPDDVALSRRVPVAVFGPAGPEALVGMRVRDAAYAPSSIGALRATKGAVRMRISAPAGTRAAVNPQTGEIILNRDLDMVVTRVEKNGVGGFDMHVVVLPKTAAKTDGTAPVKTADAVKKATPKKAPASKPLAPAAEPAAKPKKPAGSGNTEPTSATSSEAFRADLMRQKVPQLKDMMRERGLKPGTLRKNDLVGALTADEFGDDAKASPNTGKPSVTAPATPKPEPTPAEKILAGDFSGLKRVGNQGGSNPGGVYEAADGSRWYVKAQKSEQHAANEALASALYREAGIDVPQVVRGAATPGLPDGTHTASRLVDGAVSDLKSRLTDNNYKQQVQAGFGVDAWLSNWDVAGASHDNIVTGADGKPWRIDLGGSLLYRAQGSPKGAAFGSKPDEWMSLRDPNTAPVAAQLFAGMSRPDLVAAVERVEQVSPARIRELTAEHNLEDVADTLIARRADLIGRLAALRVQAERQAAWNAVLAGATEGPAALDAALLRRTAGQLRPAPAGWSAVHVNDASMALGDYQGLEYKSINQHMRSGGGDPDIITTVDRVTDAINASPLASDVVVYRGISHATATFGAAWNSVDVVGLEWDDKAFASTSADRRVAEDYFAGGGSAPVVMRIVQRAGTGAVKLSDMAPASRAPSGIAEEAELLFGPQRRRVVADHGVDLNGRRILDVEVVS